jgi:virginiamycin B lyase
MRRFVFTILATVVALGVPGISIADASAQEDAGRQEMSASEVRIQEWEVPYPESRPRDPYVAPDGRVWFVGQRSDYLAVLDPESGEFSRFDLPKGAGPHNQIVSEDGSVWYAGNRAAHIGKLDPATGEIQQFPMPDGDPRDPHTLVHDGRGGIWFTAQGANKVGHLDPATGEVKLVEAPERPGRGGEMTGVRPYGIKVDSHGRPWIALVGSNLVGTVDPATMEMTTYEVPEGAAPRRLEIDSDDMVWYVDYARGKLARLDPATGDVKEWDSPGGPDSGPYGMAIDASDRIWYVETGADANPFVGFDPATEEFTVTPIPSGAGAVRHMYYDESTNSVWFGTDNNTIGQAKLPPLRGRNVTDLP